ncbi:YjiH family protein [Thalassobacillus sp. C254]|uniref:YjiH family protein n=1 Tax=Thalassobacillus sp. C254 TaxID=1225341 RepID=UPI0006D1FF7E|nr:YjiH family protein [Thalassobacillus sp. C254]
MRFIIPSLIGIFLFMIPISYDGSVTIPVAILAGMVEELLGPALPAIVTILIGLAVVGTLLAKVAAVSWITNNTFLDNLFSVTPIWFIVRIIGFILAVITLFQWGPEWIWHEYTGGLMLFDLLPLLFTVFLFAGLFLPLLLNFGLLEFVGTLLNKIMRPLFTLPGRSSIDSLASWMGDGTIGVLLTNQQYEQGYYTKREAAVIGTTFSVVSITFSIVIIELMELGHMIIPYYLTIVAAGLVAALIMPRIPPLSRKSDDYYEKAERKGSNDQIPENTSAVSHGLRQAAAKAHENKFRTVASGGVKNVLDMWLGVLPIVMALGTIAVIIAEFTPFFVWLGTPFIPLLELMQVPYAAEASQTMLIGFADMFLPAVIGADIASEFTRFVIACLSVTQLIYMSEVGGLLLASKLPVRFIDLVIIFIQRTIITLPVIVVIAHFIF